MGTPIENIKSRDGTCILYIFQAMGIFDGGAMLYIYAHAVYVEFSGHIRNVSATKPFHAEPHRAERFHNRASPVTKRLHKITAPN
jgi:hypothetical protein